MARSSAVRNRKRNAMHKKRGKGPTQVRKQTSAARIEMPAAKNRRGQAIRKDAGEHAAHARVHGGADVAEPVALPKNPTGSGIDQVLFTYEKAMELALDAIQAMFAMSFHSLRTWQTAWLHSYGPQR